MIYNGVRAIVLVFVVALTSFNCSSDHTKSIANDNKLKEVQVWLKNLGVKNDYAEDYTIKQLSELEELDLQRTQVKDEQLIYLQALRNLTSLDLSYTPITDKGTDHLRALKSNGKIKYIDLSNTKITVNGIRALQSALPNCVLSYHW